MWWAGAESIQAGSSPFHAAAFNAGGRAPHQERTWTCLSKKNRRVRSFGARRADGAGVGRLAETRDDGASMPIGISRDRDLSSGQTYLLAGEEARWFVVDGRGRRVGAVQVDCQNGALNGTWPSPDHRQVRKIQARVATAEAPLRSGGSWQGLAPVVLSRQTSGDLSYEVLGFRRFLGRESPSKPDGDVHGKLRGLRLIGKAPGIPKLNAALEASFVSAFHFYASCVDWHPRWYKDDRTSLVERIGNHVVIRQETADKCDEGATVFRPTPRRMT